MSVIKHETHLYGVKYWRMNTPPGVALAIYTYQGTDVKLNRHYFKRYGSPYSILTYVDDAKIGVSIFPFLLESGK